MYGNDPILSEVKIEVIKEFQAKLNLLKVPRGISIEKILITINGADASVEKLGYFDKILKLEDLFIKYE